MDKEVLWKNAKQSHSGSLGIFTHIPAYSGIIQGYSYIFSTLCNPGVFRTLVYLETWHIQNHRRHN